MTVPTENRPTNDGFLTDTAVRPDDGPIDRCMLFDPALPPDDAVRPDPRASLHDDALINEARAVHRDARLDPGLRRDTRRRRPFRKRRGPVAAVHDVLMHLHVFLGGANVDPI